MSKAREKVIDEFLVVRCQEGNREAFDLIVRRWQRRLWRYARRLTGSHHAAWDVVQESWMAILRRIRGLSDPAWFSAWAYRIVRNKCADHCRRAGRRRNLVDAFAGQDCAGDPASGDDAGDELRTALRRLPAEQRELLALRYTAELNTLEIAVVLGIPAGTVKSRLHAAREELRRFLKGDES